MSYNLDAREYAPLQTGRSTNIVLTNISSTRMVVTQTLLKFDWMGTRHWYRNCNVEIEPNHQAILPDVPFKIDLATSSGSHIATPGVTFKLLEEGKWVDYKEQFGKGGIPIFITPLQPKDYTVFVSHSNHEDDENLIKACKQAMKTCGITSYFAEERPRPGYRLWDKIRQEIVNSDAFLVLWTKRASQSGDIREEIGIAIGAKKFDRIIPIVQKDTDVVGSLKSREPEWAIYTPPNHTEALSEALTTIMEWAKEKEAKKARKARTPIKTIKVPVISA